MVGVERGTLRPSGAKVHDMSDGAGRRFTQLDYRASELRGRGHSVGPFAVLHMTAATLRSQSNRPRVACRWRTPASCPPTARSANTNRPSHCIVGFRHPARKYWSKPMAGHMPTANPRSRDGARPTDGLRLYRRLLGALVLQDITQPFARPPAAVFPPVWVKSRKAKSQNVALRRLVHPWASRALARNDRC